MIAMMVPMIAEAVLHPAKTLQGITSSLPPSLWRAYQEQCSRSCVVLYHQEDIRVLIGLCRAGVEVDESVAEVTETRAELGLSSLISRKSMRVAAIKSAIALCWMTVGEAMLGQGRGTPGSCPRVNLAGGRRAFKSLEGSSCGRGVQERREGAELSSAVRNTL